MLSLSNWARICRPLRGQRASCAWELSVVSFLNTRHWSSAPRGAMPLELPAPIAVEHRHVDAAVLVTLAEIEGGGLVVEVGIEHHAAVLAVGHRDRPGAVLLQRAANRRLVLHE